MQLIIQNCTPVYFVVYDTMQSVCDDVRNVENRIFHRTSYNEVILHTSKRLIFILFYLIKNGRVYEIICYVYESYRV